MSDYPETPEPQRFAQMIRLKPEHKDEYIKIHAEVWPSVLAQIKKSNISNYSIFYDEPLGLLIATFTYTGPPGGLESDMAAMAADPETNRWWALTDPMQESLNEGAVGSEDSGKGGISWWRGLREVFHLE